MLAIVCADLIHFGPSLYAEPAFVALGLAAMGSAGGTRAAGAALVRAAGLFPAAVLAAVRGGWALARFTAPVALVALVLSLHHGAFLPLAGSAGKNLWTGHGPGATGDWRDPGPPPPGGYGAAALAAIRNDPARAVARVGSNVVRLWSASRSDPTLATRPLPLPLVPFLPLVLLGAIGVARSLDRGLLGWLVATTLATSFFFVPVRYKLALYPALLPAAGIGLALLTRYAAGLGAALVARGRRWAHGDTPGR